MSLKATAMAAAEADPFVSTTAPTVVLANAPTTGATPSRPAASRDGAKPLCFSPAAPGRPAAQGLGLMHPASTPAPVPTTNIVPMRTTTALMPASGAAATTPASAGKPSPTASMAGTPLTVASTTSPRPTKTKRRSRPRPRATGNGEWNTGKWSKDEDAALRHGVSVVGARQWKRISVEFLHNQRSDVQCLHRWQKVLRPGLVKGSWEKEEDETIVRCIQNGIVKWSEIAAHIPGRLGKQCRERWFNHLDPTIKKGGWTSDEDAILEQAQAALGTCSVRCAVWVGHEQRRSSWPPPRRQPLVQDRRTPPRPHRERRQEPVALRQAPPGARSPPRQPG